ncbi:hypothetical protein D770_11355 [Flammeovirgaceae bacterium 311]|nr:hypothetical protein D770_11355 [Flammeovirgaceae bacterium 311]
MGTVRILPTRHYKNCLNALFGQFFLCTMLKSKHNSKLFLGLLKPSAFTENTMSKNETFPLESGKIYPFNLNIFKSCYIEYKV